jgi:diguanylate cyclase (GGDEF)-like protein
MVSLSGVGWWAGIGLYHRRPKPSPESSQSFKLERMTSTNYFQWPLLRLETPEYQEKRFEDHREFTMVMFTMSMFLGLSLWIWDYVTDPVGAMNTIWLRLMYVAYGIFPFAFKKIQNRQVMAWLIIGTLIAGEILFGEILNRLQGGSVYGIGGFLIFMYAPTLLLAGYSLGLNALYLVLAAGIPQVLAWVGFIEVFQQKQYAVLIWPTAVTMLLAHFAYTQNYWRRYQSELELQRISNTDPLTQVSNRRNFIPTLQKEIARSQRTKRPVSLLMIDIDLFKHVNDKYGHPTGDRVICTLADTCTRVTRKVDLVARIGGEEFAVLLPETPLADALVLAERLRQTFEATHMASVTGEQFQVTISIGVAEQSPGELSSDKIIRMADAALYRAKSGGRNRVESVLEP